MLDFDDVTSDFRLQQYISGKFHERLLLVRFPVSQKVKNFSPVIIYSNIHTVEVVLSPVISPSLFFGK
jgi:hypothetical protein